MNLSDLSMWELLILNEAIDDKITKICEELIIHLKKDRNSQCFREWLVALNEMLSSIQSLAIIYDKVLEEEIEADTSDLNGR